MMIERLSQEHSIERMCRLFSVSRSGYYKYINQGKRTKRSIENNILLRNIFNIWLECRRVYGSPRITMALRQRGYKVNRKRVVRLMQLAEIKAIKKKKYHRTTNSEHNKAAAPNLLLRNFRVPEINRVWLSDITYIRTREGFLYLAVIMDLCSRMPLAIQMQRHLGSELVSSAFLEALKSRNYPKDLIFHSDQGIQYASDEFRKILRLYGVTQSMSRKGNCYDNAPMESFFHTLKTEMVSLEKFNTRLEAEQALKSYIKDFYTTTRLHSSLGYKTPFAFEQSLFFS
jgi:putative transposase